MATPLPIDATAGRDSPNGLPALGELIAAAARILRSARHAVVVTGAGVSAESRIPTFRDTMSGLWKDFDPQKLATPEAFAADPEMVTRWYDWRRLRCAEAEPNPGHVALASLQRWLDARGGLLTLLTQNVDGLHQRAGSRDVVELHGSLSTWRDAVTDEPWTPPTPPQPFDRFPPLTPRGNLARPGVVWFGEALDEGIVQRAFEAASTCDVFMSVGTSAVVYPAAGFARVAHRHGAPVIEVNPDATPLRDVVDIALRGPSGELLPRLLEAMA